MIKMLDVRTVVTPVTGLTAESVSQHLREAYLEQGYVLFNTHYMGVVSGVTGEVQMVYIFVKYADEAAPPALWDVAMTGSDKTVVAAASKRRGRKPKAK